MDKIYTQEDMDTAVRKAKLEILHELDFAYHDNIDMQSEVSVHDIKKAGIEFISVDDPRTKNNVFRHIRRLINQLTEASKEKKGK